MLLKKDKYSLSRKLCSFPSSYKQAFDQLLVAKAKLAQVQAGAKTGDINAQKLTITRLNSQVKGDIATQIATINRIEAEVENAQKESNRYQQLYKDGAVSASVVDSKNLVLKTTQQQLKEAEATLKRTEDTFQDCKSKEENPNLIVLKKLEL